jgi:hypothetical protein
MTATVVCPNGHQSTTADYCDQCGSKIDGGSPPVAAVAPPPDPTAVSPVAATDPEPAAAPAEVCPSCGVGRVGTDRFCEDCGYDFVGGITSAARAAGSTGEAAWDAVVSADRAYFDRMATPDVTFPPVCPDRTFPLAGAELRVGRRSASRGIYPEIDLSGAPEDSAISHLHVLLVRTADGSYSLVDPGSTNGTTLNDDPNPVAPNAPIPLVDGDRVHVGAWTTITIHARSPAA